MSAPGVAGAIVSVGGRDVDPTVASRLVDVVVDCQLRMPDRVSLRYFDFQRALMDGKTFPIGKPLKVVLGSAERNEAATVFDGLITGLEPEFTRRGVTLLVHGLDRAQLLQRTPRTATYQQMTYGQIATQLAANADLSAADISPGLLLPFVQQSNETDWDFLWRLALEVDYQVKVSGTELSFSAAAKLQAKVTRLTWGESLLAFRPRVSGVQQAQSVTVRGWDPATAQAIEASASAPSPESRIGVSRDQVLQAMGNAQATVVDRPVMSLEHATSIATSVAAQLASICVEGEGTAQGTPGLTVGSQARVEKVGSAFSGVYAITGVRHRYRARTGYRTDFSIRGRADRSLLGLTRAPQRAGWRRRIAVGVVTDKTDPDKLGRVRVRYPTLGNDHAGWWARVLAPGSGAGRGFFSLPQVGDEVLVAFEHESDQHPYVLGSVFNGPGAPGAVVQPDGAFTLATPSHVSIDAAKQAEITTKDTFTLTASASARLTTKPPPAEGEGEGAGGGSQAKPPVGAIELDAKGALTLSGQTGASISSEQAATLSAKSGVTISGGQRVQVSADGTISISGATISITADQAVRISASQIILG
ncbi:MAG: VgrG-related protein [Solirubrobacteraceae bacterium]